jgi:Domain of Unknown Function (DUF930)
MTSAAGHASVSRLTGPGDPHGAPMSWSLLGSLLVHVGFAAALLLLVANSVPPVRAPQPLSVEFVTEQQFRSLTEPAPAVLSVPAEIPTIPDDTVERGMIQARTLLASGVLDNPLSAQAREMLPYLAGEERMEQLCNLEAMEQVHAWREEFQPDRLVAYATADTRISDHTVFVEGGALRSGHRWYAIRYRCDLTAGHDVVTAFAFEIGAAIPRSRWEELSLPAED